MLHTVSRQCCMIRLQIQFEVIHQIVLSKKVQTGSCIRIVLVFRRFFRLRFDIEWPFKFEFLLIINSHLKECTEVVHLALEISIE